MNLKTITGTKVLNMNLDSYVTKHIKVLLQSAAFQDRFVRMQCYKLLFNKILSL